MRLFYKNSKSMHMKYFYKLTKIAFIIILLSLTILLGSTVYASSDEIGIYGKDYFGEEYSNGYIRNCSSADVIGMSDGVSVKTGKQINKSNNYYYDMNFYTSNNTSKYEYIDYSKAVRYINSKGEPIWLDMRVYVWTDNINYPWTLRTDWFHISHLFNDNIQHTIVEFHFYTSGYCGNDDYEQPFKGITCLADMDTKEGYGIYSGYNKFYLTKDTALISILKGNNNSNNSYNPFTTSGVSEYSYFFGTRMNDSIDNVWIEIDSTPNSTYKIVFGTRNTSKGGDMFYMGTPIEYYVDGELKDTSYSVPYGSYKLINPSKMDNVQEGYTVDGWYTDASYTTKAENGIAGESTIKVYGKSIPKETYTITVDNENFGHTYNSYQVFQGDYSEKVDEEGNKTPILSNIEWGTELNKEVENGKTHGDKIIELLKEKNPDLYKDCETADDVARVLQGNDNDGDVIREFTDVVGKYILDNNIEITKGTNTVVEDKDENGNVIDKNYKITYLDPGYYIVIDAEANPKDDAYSRYLIDVVQNVTMEPKTSTPKLNKKVIGNNLKKLVDESYVVDDKRNTATYKEESEIYNAEDYDIEFELKSYIPNPDGYNTYKFEIVDILAKGFDYDRNSVKVMLGSTEYPKTRVNESGETVNNYTVRDVVISESNYETYKSYFEEEGKEYPERYAENQYGKTLILIEINDLIEQLKVGVIEKAQDIIVTYNAKLNGKGEVGTTPNTNEAYLKYSNNPYNNAQITQTTTQTTYTYTIDLDVSKIEELKSETDEKKYLEGAEFEIYSEPNTVEDREPIATITTDELGQTLYSSLGAGTYYLKEVKAPEGYNKLREEVVIEVTATCDEFGTITWTVEDKTNNNLILVQIVEKEGTTIPEIKLQVENTSGFQLPSTGGIGTVIFTVGGLSIMLVAITCLKLNKKKI